LGKGRERAVGVLFLYVRVDWMFCVCGTDWYGKIHYHYHMTIITMSVFDGVFGGESAPFLWCLSSHFHFPTRTVLLKTSSEAHNCPQLLLYILPYFGVQTQHQDPHFQHHNHVQPGFRVSLSLALASSADREALPEGHFKTSTTLMSKTFELTNRTTFVNELCRAIHPAGGGDGSFSTAVVVVNRTYPPTTNGMSCPAPEIGPADISRLLT